MARVGGNFKSLLGRLPSAVADEIRETHNQMGRFILSRAKARVPRRTGGLANALAYKVLPKSLKLKVGLLTKALNKKFFYGRIVEFGRKAKTVIAKRRGTFERAKAAGLNVRSNRYKRAALNAGISGAYKFRVGPLPPRHFIYTLRREEIYRPYQKVWGKAIHRAAMGTS